MIGWPMTTPWRAPWPPRIMARRSRGR